MEERRQHLRINDSLKISYHVISPPDGHGDTTSMNISKGGISLPMDQRLLPGMVLELKIFCSGYKGPIAATGEIVWVKDRDSSQFPYLTGLKFVRISLRDRDRIYYYINKKVESGEIPGIEKID